MEWHQVKIALAQATGVSPDALHVLIGVAAQLLLAALFRVSLRSWAPWIIILAVATGNEWLDLAHETWPDRAQQWGETIKDIALTMALPTLLMILARIAPSLFVASGTIPTVPGDAEEN